MWLSNAAIFLALGQAGWFHTGSMGKQYFEKCFFSYQKQFSYYNWHWFARRDVIPRKLLLGTSKRSDPFIPTPS